MVEVHDRTFALVPAGSSDGRAQFVDFGDGVARLLDDQLRPVLSREVVATRILAAQGLDLLVTQGDGGTVIIGASVVALPDLRCDAAAFLGPLLLATAPAVDAHRLLLIDPTQGEVLDEQSIPVEDAAAFITTHPVDAAAIVEFPMGQDGVVVVRVEIVDRTLRVEEILSGQDPVIAGFDPSGTRLLVTPYPSDPDVARVLAWPSFTEVARLTAQDLDTPIGIGLPGCWLDEESIGLYAMEDAFVVTDGVLARPQRVSLPIEFGDNGDLETLVSLAPGRVAVGTWTPAGRSTLVLEP